MLKLKRELQFIINVSKNNLPIKCSRKFTSGVAYTKHITVIKINKSNIIFNKNFNKRRSKILIAIHSHISLFYQRYVFRNIYKLYKDITLLFFVALDFNKNMNNLVYKESKIYKDIVIFNFYGNYNSLYFLTYNFLKWVKKYYYLYDVIVKQDTDTFINVKIMRSILDNLYTNRSFVMGYIWKYKNKNLRYPSGMSYVFLSKSINELTINIDEVFNNITYGYAEDKFFGILSRSGGFIFIDVKESYNYTSYLEIPNYLFDIKKVYMIHWLRISEIAYFHLKCNNRIHF